MRRLGLFGLALALALVLTVVIHLGWHFAMPNHHAYALDWPQHWMLPALSFFAIGSIIGRVWKAHAALVALGVALLAILTAQGFLPVLEVAVSEQRLGYGSDSVRWNAFFVYMGVGLPALLGATWLLRPRTGTGRSRSAV